MIKLNKTALIIFILCLTAILTINDPGQNKYSPEKIAFSLAISIFLGFGFKFFLEKSAAWMYRKFGTKKE
jgi:hypothetical protein